MTTSRRDFMKFAAAGTAGMAISEALPRMAEALTGKGPQDSITVHLTAGDKRFALEAPLEWQPLTAGAADIVLDPATSYQEILGFGAAFTDAACYNFNQLSEEARQKLLHELFSPAEMNFSACRTCIGASDYATKLYSYDEGSEPDLDLKRFSIEHDKQYLLPTMRMARKINPDLFLLGSPWSPPAWMKTNRSMLGGTLHKRYYAPYAQYFVKYLKAYEADGVPINAVSSQNEVDTDQDANMPACLFGQEYEIEFVAKHLGPALANNNINTKIWILDHNYNLWGRAICELDEPELNKYVDGVAWHGYVGQPEMMTRVHNAHPTKHAYWTEGGPEYTDPKYQTDWANWSTTFTGILRNWSRCIIAWNLALDENGKPNIGPFSCGGVVTIDSKTREIRRSGQYWAFAHFSKAIRRGAKRLDSKGAIKDVSHIAFVNPDGSKVLVLTNAGPQKQIAVQLAKVSTKISLPADSVATLTW